MAEESTKAFNLQEALGPNMTAEVRTEEHPDDRAARIRREDREHRVGIYLRVAIFAVLVLLLFYFGWLLLNPTLAPSIRQLATTGITSIVTGLLGYFVGRRS